MGREVRAPNGASIVTNVIPRKIVDRETKRPSYADAPVKTRQRPPYAGEEK